MNLNKQHVSVWIRGCESGCAEEGVDREASHPVRGRGGGEELLEVWPQVHPGDGHGGGDLQVRKVVD